MADISPVDIKQLLVVSHENWAGIISCSQLDQTPQNMVEFVKESNGDIKGRGGLENGESLLLIDCKSLLKQQGFLLVDKP